jgi:hypothetical protein
MLEPHYHYKEIAAVKFLIDLHAADGNCHPGFIYEFQLKVEKHLVCQVCKLHPETCFDF